LGVSIKVINRKTTRRVYILGVGGKTPLGMNLISSAAAVRAGISTASEHPYMIDKGGSPMIVAMSPDLDLSLPISERFSALFLSAMQETLNNLNLSSIRKISNPVRVLIGLPEDRPGLESDISMVLEQRLQRDVEEALGPIDFQTFPFGHASGLIALQQGCQVIQRNECDFCIIGGVDSYITPETLEWIDDQEQLHSEDNSWGFLPSEGAGVCLLSSEKGIENLNDKILCQVVGVGVALEDNTVLKESVCIGLGLSMAFKGAVADISKKDLKINNIISDINGEPYRGSEFGFTMVRNTSLFTESAECQTPADCWGDVGAASSPLHIGLAVMAAQKGYSGGPNTLVWASSIGQHRGAALINTFNREEMNNG
jgi:3-oxoacyl-[acyl-carrier-protein] synthase I